MKPFIDSNTQKRAQAKHEFEKAYVTLMNYSVFGKCKENFQKKCEVDNEKANSS